MSSLVMLQKNEINIAKKKILSLTERDKEEYEVL